MKPISHNLFRTCLMAGISISLLFSSCSKDAAINNNTPHSPSTDTVFAGQVKDSAYFHKIDTLFTFYTYLDLDRDSVKDLQYTSYYDYHPYVWHEANYLTIINKSFQGAMTSDSISTFMFTKGENITTYTIWGNSGHTGNIFTLTDMSTAGNPPPPLSGYDYWYMQTGYIGLRKIDSSGIYHYGWLYVDVIDAYECRLISYYFKS